MIKDSATSFSRSDLLSRVGMSSALHALSEDLNETRTGHVDDWAEMENMAVIGLQACVCSVFTDLVGSAAS